MANDRDLSDKSTKELPIVLAAAQAATDYVIVIDADTGEPRKMLISQLDTLIT